MESANEEFLLLLLSDSNLPTGGFIASSGLESYLQHGYLVDPTNATGSKSIGILGFVRKSIHSYARLNLPFLTASHRAVAELKDFKGEEKDGSGVDKALERIRKVDRLFEAMTLNHVSKRASVAQGVALLTLFDKSFSPPTTPGSSPAPEKIFVERLRATIRKGESFGHHPIGFGIITAALSLSLPASQNLFLFLHARSILSSAIRLNIIGPYISHRLLLHDVRPLIDEAMDRCKDLELELDSGVGPVVTWPLGEILAARHDTLHSKIFNS